MAGRLRVPIRAIETSARYDLSSSCRKMPRPIGNGYISASSYCLSHCCALSSCGDQASSDLGLELYVFGAAGATPKTHSRQSEVWHVIGQPPPSATNNAAVSDSRFASAITRDTTAVR